MNIFKSLREQIGISQRELSEKTGLTTHRISNLEHVHKPTSSELKLFADFYNIDVSYLHSMMYKIEEDLEIYY